MKPYAIAALTCLLTLSFSTFAQEETSKPAPQQEAPKPASRPPEVEEARWIPISESFGFVITEDLKTSEVKLPGQWRKTMKVYPKGQQVSGYFVVRRGEVWCRVVTEPNPGVVLPLTRR